MSVNRRSGVVVLLALVLSGAAFAAGKAPAGAVPRPEAPAVGSPAAADDANHVVRVYYFRTNTRCTSCRKIEAFTDEAIRQAFSREIEDGKMIWQVVNVQEPGNEHFVKEYQLATKSVVVVDLVGDRQVRWKNLAKIWELLGDQQGFARHVQDEVRQYLAGPS